MAESSRPVQIFAVYDQRDESFFEDLKKHLAPQVRRQLLDIHGTSDLTPGQDLEKFFEGSLATADMILMLVSPDFLNRKEFDHQLESRLKGSQKTIHPILVRPA